MRDPYPGTAPDYTAACVVMFGVNLTWILTLIWALWGLVIAVLFGMGLNRLITFLHIRAQTRAAADRAAPKAKVRS